MELIEDFRNLSGLEKGLIIVGLGGVLANKIIPNEYVRADVISLGVSALSSIGLLIKRTWNDVVYPLEDSYFDKDNNQF